MQLNRLIDARQTPATRTASIRSRPSALGPSMGTRTGTPYCFDWLWVDRVWHFCQTQVDIARAVEECQCMEQMQDQTFKRTTTRLGNWSEHVVAGYNLMQEGLPV